ncbi:MGT family glycosyltransferase [Actinokineospora auranticolor]|uniref:MGT family glycosyltransferase n=1 Tax=Actinokineospora auranticolor TaxID=155976 RepID=A0A2S6H1F7_9PSEU|nr:MGT family glycosyltransferase [Actinokineospora auranticolor]
MFLPYPSAGHVTPTLAVAEELIRRGHRVTYAVTPAVAATAAGTGAAVIEYDTALMSTVTPPAKWSDDEVGRAFLQYVSEIIGTTAAIERQLADRADAIAYDSTVWAPGRVLGRKWGVPTCQLLPVFASNETYSLMRAQVDHAGHPELAADHPAVLAFGELMRRFLADNGLDPDDADEITTGKGERSLVFLPRSLQPHGDTFGPDHLFVGPCPRPGRAPTWAPPGDGRPVAFVSLGTVVNDQPEFFRVCADALGDLPWHVVLATGDAEVPPLPANFEAHPWVPYDDVLPHADVFVTQAGMGGILAAGRHATPLVVAPFQPEQRINAARLVELGLGRRVDPSGLTAADLRDAVRAAVAGGRAHLGAFRADIAAAGGAPRAADFLESGLDDTAIDLPRRRACPFDPPTGYRDLAAERPRRLSFPGGGEGWLVTRYEHAKAVLSDARFSHRSELLASPLPPPFELPPGDHRPPAAEPGAFNKMDPPDHTHYRRVIGHLFSPRAATDLRPAIEAVASELLDAMAVQGAADLVRDFARPLPARVIFDLLGVPVEIRDPLQDNLDTIMRLQMTLEELIDAVTVVGQLLDDMVANGLSTGALADLAARGDLSAVELRNLAWALLGGGTDTTSNMISLGTFALLVDPARRAGLLSDVDNTVEELLRYLTISQFGASRCALEDVQVGGVLVRAGETVVVSLPAANRDAARFPEPDRLDLARDVRGHLAFGHGVHKCVGQYLARETLRVAYPALFTRFPDLRLAVEPEELRLRDDMDHYGVHEMPVTW